MKRYVLLLFSLMIFGSLSAGKWVSINSTDARPANIKLVSSDIHSSTVEFSLGGFYLNEVSTSRGMANFVTLEGATPLLGKGMPDLPKLTASLIIPDQAATKVKVLSYKYRDFNNITIAPSKGDLTRDVDPATVPYVYGPAYEVNAFWPGNIADAREPYIVRDYRGQTLIAMPFQYNPVTRTLRVYYNITVKLMESGKGGVNTLNVQRPLKRISREFRELYGHQFHNYHSVKYTPVEEQGNMLIISYAAFMPAMQPFVNWKISEGIPVEMVDVATIGNSTAIKAFVKEYYEGNGLTFLVLVGDHQQVPAYMATSGASDNSYGFTAGNDHYPDLFVGRFSAENVEQVTTQVNKSLYYEINPNPTGGWLAKGIGIASEQGPGDDNEMDYEHVRNLRTQLMNFTYESCAELYDGSQGGEDEPNDPTPAMVQTELEEGAGIILYCGHGSQTSWGSSGYSNSQINTVQNSGMLPFIWAVACVNGDFTNATCFAEAWLRAKQGNELTGAVATLMSTINQSWDPPMEGEDEMVAILVESYSNNIKRTFGGLSMNGCMKMNDTYGTGGYSMTDTWNLFGDPSLMVRTKSPDTMLVSHVPTAFIGVSQLQVNCDKEGALACVSMNNQILGTAYVSGGIAMINFLNPVTVIDTLTVVVTAFNYFPYIGQVPVITASGPFLTMQSYVIHDPTGNNNSKADFGETINLDFTIQNLGVAVANSVHVVVSSSDTLVTITDDNQAFGDVVNGTSSTQNAAFTFIVDGFIPDNHPVPFNALITDTSGNSWTSAFSIVINAPVLAVGSLQIDDAATGNGNGVLDAGETADIIISNLNNGHAATGAAFGILNTSCPYLTINGNNQPISNISANGTTDVTFSITVSPTAPSGTSIDLAYAVYAGPYNASHLYYFNLGICDEDFESGDLTQYNWQTGGDIPWIVTNINPYEGVYCARSGDISDDQTTDLYITLDVLTNDSISFWRKVSSENNYDFLRFFIDNTQKQQWSGEKAWQRFVYAVSSGTHTFLWRYEKDGYMSNGSDAAWIDYIIFPPSSFITSIGGGISQNALGFSIYPNPAAKNMNITFTMENTSMINLGLFDANGRLVQTLEQNSHLASGTYTVSMSVSGLANGIYFCKLQNDDGIQVRKVLVQH